MLDGFTSPLWRGSLCEVRTHERNGRHIEAFGQAIDEASSTSRQS